MNTLPSKIQVRKDMPVPGSRELMPSIQNDDAPIHRGAGVLVVQGSMIQPVKRLIVLVPNVDLDEAQMAHEIWKMASPVKLPVILLSMCNDLSEELSLQRRLITLAALIREPRVAVETRIENGGDWRRGVRSILEDGDVILCHEEQRVGLRHKPLVDVLDSLHVPVWTLSGFYPLNVIPQRRWLKQTAFWLVAIAILVGFFYLQIQINILPASWAKNAMLYLSVLVEIGSIWAWNSVIV